MSSKLIDVREWTLDMRHAGRCITELMQRRDVSQTELIGATGLGRNIPSKYMNGVVKAPSVEAALKIYGAFGLSPNRMANDFMGWEERGGKIKSPEWDELESLVLTVADDPARKAKLMEHVLAAARVYMSMNSK